MPETSRAGYRLDFGRRLEYCEHYSTSEATHEVDLIACISLVIEGSLGLEVKMEQ